MVSRTLLLAAAAHYWFFLNLPLKFALPLAAVMNVVGVLGDLTESALKRSAGAKDTAQILPGHGGILFRGWQEGTEALFQLRLGKVAAHRAGLDGGPIAGADHQAVGSRM